MADSSGCRSGGAYQRDKETGHVTRISDPLAYHPEGNAARHGDGSLAAAPTEAPVLVAPIAAPTVEAPAVPVATAEPASGIYRGWPVTDPGDTDGQEG